MSTIGERKFEKFCVNNGFTCNKIMEQEIKTPDYEFFVGETRIIAEIKDLEFNDDEKNTDKYLKALKESGSIGISPIIPGKRIRLKIGKAKKQLKKSVTDNAPTMLILFDNRRFLMPKNTDMDPYHMKVAMDRDLRKGKNPHISAIGVLKNDRLVLYHNVYAEKPLSKELFFNLPMIDQPT